MSSKPGWHEERMANFILMTTGGNPEVDLVQDGWTEMFKVDVKKEPRDEAEAAELKALDRQLMDAVRAAHRRDRQGSGHGRGAEAVVRRQLQKALLSRRLPADVQP